MDGTAPNTWQQIWQAVVDHSVHTNPPTPGSLWPVIVLVVLVIAVPQARRWGRALGTIVHEAGHAVVGLAVGRRFHGFTVARDLSGTAVTSGPERGVGRALTSWSGYPAPAFLGAVLTATALRGWVGASLAGLTLSLLLLLLMSRSLRTLGMVGLVALLTLTLWWWGDAVVPLRGGVVAGIGVVLLLGAWDALLDVAHSHDSSQDHRTLARITFLPAWFWLGTWVVVCAACTWVVVRAGSGVLW
ncbi:M50 family metallopeptidase [Actinomyces trachealis]|uniref:M50 family metallopeptidase n=1 Tax=Actinomyces trachealis TaxID=2763540 RepID=UPI0018C74D84|nr:M50 family metallopeptidase [Actinomyces trachealis]